MKNFQVILVKSDLGASLRGAAKGPEAILKAAEDQARDVFSNYPIAEISAEKLKHDKVADKPFARHIDQVVEISSRVAETVKNALSEQRFVLIFSGDHSAAAGAAAGLKMAFIAESVGLIWIDAHADLHSPYTTPSGNLHGMPLAVSLGLNSRHLQQNSPDEQTLTAWQQFKNIGGFSPKLSPKDLVLVGLRDMEKEEEIILDELQIPRYSVDELRLYGVENLVAKVFQRLSHCRHIFVSFDVDSLDPTVSRATGTPVDGGFTRQEALSLISEICSDKRLVGIEIVEINPDLEQGNTMGEIGFELASAVIDIVNKRENHAH
jgi:arginase